MNAKLINPYYICLFGCIIIISIVSRITFGQQADTDGINKSLEPIVIADFSASVTEGKEPLTVQFNDKSEGDVLERLWDFGDGNSSNEQNPVHTYKDSGNYDVTLYVSGADSIREKAGKKGYIKVLRRSEPKAEFLAIPITGDCPLRVNFLDESKGANLSSWAWDFGNGNTSAEQNQVVTYRTPGIYTVKLTVSNSLGADLNGKINLIHVKQDIGPTAAFMAMPLIADINKEIKFNDFSSGKTEKWLWDFDDGMTSAEKNPRHAFSKEGLYSVSLTVSGPDGADSLTKGDYIRIIKD